MLRRVFFRWLLKFYEDKHGLLWQVFGILFYRIYKTLLNYEQHRFALFTENIEMEKGQLELLKIMIEKNDDRNL